MLANLVASWLRVLAWESHLLAMFGLPVVVAAVLGTAIVRCRWLAK